MRKYSPSMYSSFLCFILILMMIFAPDVSLQAQVTGVVAGRVVDASSGDFLPGANVFLEGTTIGAATDREGSFVILNVPEGTYTLMINYIGYSDFSTDFTISSSQTRVVLDDIQMQISAFESDAILVEGQLEGQIRALNRQRVSANIKNVVSREQMEKFPDYTTADVLQRVPGVFIDRSQGEGRYVLVRGTEPRLTNVKVNGEELATNRVNERYAQLDIVGSNQMASIEVIKALTPDMDGDAIGGTVNLITRNAFDYQGQRLRATVGAGYADLRGNALWQGKFSYSDRFGADGNIGLTLTANWDRTDKGAHNNEKEWEDVTTQGGTDIPLALQDFDFRDYYNIRDRIGFGGSFEYRLDNDNRFYVNGMWNKLNDDQERGRTRFRLSQGDLITENVIEGARLYPIMESRTEKLIQQQISAGGSHQFDMFGLDYKVSYSYGEEQHPEQLSTEFRVRNVNMELDLSDSEFPGITFTNLADVDIYDPSVYDFRDMDYRETFASDQNIVGAMNFKMPFNLGDFASELKFGGKVRSKKKDRDDDRWEYSWNGPDLTLADFVDTDKPGDKKDFFRDHYRYGPQGDADALLDFFKANRDGLLEGELDIWDSEGQSYEAKETILAGYAMATVNVNKLTVLAGGRFESTTNDYKGTVLFYDDGGDLIVNRDSTDERTYSHFLPMLHLKYQLGRMTNMRAAVTTTIARPNYFDLVPFREEDPSGPSLRLGNPNLETTEALNFDLMAEHYFPGVGVISGGYFYKSLKNILYETEFDIDDPGNQYDGWEFRGPVNGGDATVQGIELNWQQQLTFLPGFWSGFGIYANYTHTWAESDLAKDVREGVSDLPGQASDLGNVALSYEWSGFSARVSFQYRDKYLVVVGSNEDSDEWRESHVQFDVSANMKITSQFDVFAEFVNLSDSPEVDYLGVPERPIKQEYYSWWMRAGVKYSL